jgi:hypothetical protein
LRIIAVLRYVDLCSDLPHGARRPLPAECRPKFISVTGWGARFWERSTIPNEPWDRWRLRIIAVLRYVDLCSDLPHGARRPLPAECRPKFISVTGWGARFWERSTIPNEPWDRWRLRIIAVLRYVDLCSDLPHGARRPLAATGAAPSNRTCERCAPALRAFAPPREPVRCTRRDGARCVCFRWRVQPCPTRPIFARTAIICPGRRPSSRRDSADPR